MARLGRDLVGRWWRGRGGPVGDVEHFSRSGTSALRARLLGRPSGTEETSGAKKNTVNGRGVAKTYGYFRTCEGDGCKRCPWPGRKCNLRHSLETMSNEYRALDDEPDEIADRILLAAASAGVSLPGMRPVAVELVRRMQQAKKKK